MSLDIDLDKTHDDEDLEEDLSLDIEENDELDKESLQEEETSQEVSVAEDLTLEDDIEGKIQDAVAELSEDDLSAELDESDLSSMDIPGLDSLTTNAIKEAVGEEVEQIQAIKTDIQDETEDNITETIQEDVKEELQEDDTMQQENTQSPQNKGVEALKTLLTALSDKDVVASLEGMKININITLGND